MTPAFKVPATDPAGRPSRRTLSRHLLTASPESDVARAPWTPFVAPLRASGGPYTDACKAVEASYSPTPYSQYR